MQGIKKTLLLLALSQLGACAVMSKQECLNADWRNVGYGVGSNGNSSISDAFNLRERTCAKHGAAANWKQFRQGHSDGIVQFCQLSNALELGVNGTSRAIDERVCPERDYPGFRNAFRVGYKLHELRNRVYRSNSVISDLNSRIYRYQKDIRRINKELNSNEIDKQQAKYLRRERREIRRYIYDLDREIEQCRQRLYHQQSAANDYSDYVYQDYLLSLSDKFVDPRNRKHSTSAYEKINKPKQSEFEDQIDEILNE